MGKYASITAEKYHFDRKKLLQSIKRVVPFIPVRSVVDSGVGQVSQVGQGILPSSMLKDVFDNTGPHNDTGIFMLSVTAEHPMFNIVRLYNDERLITAELNTKVSDLEKNAAPVTVTAQASNKPKKAAKKKKKNKATPMVSNSGDIGLAIEDSNISADDVSTVAENIDDDSAPATLKQLQDYIATMEKKMGDERAKMEAKFGEKLGDERAKMEAKFGEKLGDERAKMEANFGEKLGDERAKIEANFGEKLGDERAKMEAKFGEKLEEQRAQIAELEEEQIKMEKKLEDERAERRNHIAAEKTERMEEMKDLANRADDLEGWVTTKNPEYLDRIRLRALLDHGQAALAEFIGCVPPSSEAVSISRMSQAWRSKLDLPNSTMRRSDKDRLEAAITLLSACSTIPDPIRKLMQDDNAMRVLTEKSSNVRRLGNNVAHELVDIEALKGIVERSTFKKDKAGMLSILDFVQSRSPV